MFKPEMLDDAECEIEITPEIRLVHLKNKQTVLVIVNPIDQKVMVIGWKKPADVLEVADAFAHMAGHMMGEDMSNEHESEPEEDKAPYAKPGHFLH